MSVRRVHTLSTNQPCRFNNHSTFLQKPVKEREKTDNWTIGLTNKTVRFYVFKWNTNFFISINSYAISGGCTLKCNVINSYALPSFRLNRYFSEHPTLAAGKTARTYWPAQHSIPMHRSLQAVIINIIVSTPWAFCLHLTQKKEKYK